MVVQFRPAMSYGPTALRRINSSRRAVTEVEDNIRNCLPHFTHVNVRIPANPHPIRGRNNEKRQRKD